MALNFKKKKENFICENCKIAVLGNGYTNQCPQCLWSKHVDISPGDRAELCQSMMEPVGSEQSGGEWSLIHKCLKCGIIRKNKVAKDDNFDNVINTAGIV